MNPQALADYLSSLVHHRLMLSTMIWGPPGIGKSSIVAQTAEKHGLGFIDVRQLVMQAGKLQSFLKDYQRLLGI